MSVNRNVHLSQKIYILRKGFKNLLDLVLYAFTGSKWKRCENRVFGEEDSCAEYFPYDYDNRMKDSIIPVQSLNFLIHYQMTDEIAPTLSY